MEKKACSNKTCSSKQRHIKNITGHSKKCLMRNELCNIPNSNEESDDTNINPLDFFSESDTDNKNNDSTKFAESIDNLKGKPKFLKKKELKLKDNWED